MLFSFEKPYFDKEEVSCEFVGHPLLEEKKNDTIDISQFIGKNKALISVFAGSRISEINVLMPILLNFINLMSNTYNDITFIFHTTIDHIELMQSYIKKNNVKNCEIISDEKIKSHLLKKSIFAIAKSGTVSLEICNAKVPSIIIYKMNFINFLIIKILVKIKYANIINIAANEEIIPELLQSKCNSKNIYQVVSKFLDTPSTIKEQIMKTEIILNKFRTDKSSSELTCHALNKLVKS